MGLVTIVEMYSLLEIILLPGGTTRKSVDPADESKTMSVFSRSSASASTNAQPVYVPFTENLSGDHVRGAIMAISQMMPEPGSEPSREAAAMNYTIIVYCVALGTIIGMVIAITCNRNVSSTIVSIFARDAQLKGILWIPSPIVP
jgi:hypothetical protein